MSIKESFLGYADLSIGSKGIFGSVTKSKTKVFVDGLPFSKVFRYVTRYKNVQQWVSI